MTISQKERIRRSLAHGPAFPDEVASATGYPMRTCSAVLDKLCKAGVVVRSQERIKRPHTNSAYLYSIRHREWRWWTVHDIAKLRLLASEGHSVQHIARSLGRTVPSIRHQAKRSGIQLSVRKQTVWPPEVKIRAIAMKQSGSTWVQISNELGVPLGTVQQWGSK